MSPDIPPKRTKIARLDMRISILHTLLNVCYIEDIKRWREDMNFISSGKNNILRPNAASESNIVFLPRENKIQIFKPLWNFFLLYRQELIFPQTTV